jgi:hypothetical protein
VLLFAVPIFLVFSLALGRAVYRSAAELETARANLAEGAHHRAIDHYRRALRWSFNHEQAAAGLSKIAQASEAEGDLATALLAWRSLAGGLAASRMLYTGVDPAHEEAKAQIARLVAREGGASIDAGTSPERLRADHRALLEREASPHPLWGTLLLLGFVGWLGALLVLVRRGFDPSGRFHWARARGPVGGAALCFALFVLGFAFA